MSYVFPDCECSAGYEKVGDPLVGPQSCVLASRIPDDVDDVKEVYLDAVQLDNHDDAKGSELIDPSLYLAHAYATASARCTYHDGTYASDQACQALANLCVLTGYRLDHPTCEPLFESLRDARGERHDFGARASLPWLFYDRDGDQVRDDAGVATSYAFSASARNREHTLRLRAAVYRMDGSFLGTRPFDADLFYCQTKTPRTKYGGGSNSGTAWTRFGRSTWAHFRCDLQTLFEREQFFYDVYLVDPAGDCGGEECLYPVPVLTKTLRSGSGAAAKVNRNGKTRKGADDVFVRRFSFFNTVVSEQDVAEGPTHVQYLVEAILHVEARSRKPKKIHTPYLELKYRVRRKEHVMAEPKMKEAKVEVLVEYSQEQTEYFRPRAELEERLRPFGLMVAAPGPGTSSSLRTDATPEANELRLLSGTFAPRTASSSPSWRSRASWPSTRFACGRRIRTASTPSRACPWRSPPRRADVVFRAAVSADDVAATRADSPP